MRLAERKVAYPSCDKQGNITQVDYIEIKNKKLAEEKLCKFEDIEEKYNISSLSDLDNRLAALEIIKENLVVSYDESENDKPCLILSIKVNKDNLVVVYETFDKEKIDLLKEVLLCD